MNRVTKFTSREEGFLVVPMILPHCQPCREGTPCPIYYWKPQAKLSGERYIGHSRIMGTDKGSMTEMCIGIRWDKAEWQATSGCGVTMLIPSHMWSLRFIHLFRGCYMMRPHQVRRKAVSYPRPKLTLYNWRTIKTKEQHWSVFVF